MMEMEREIKLEVLSLETMIQEEKLKRALYTADNKAAI